MGWVWFLFVAWEDLVGSSGVKAFSVRAGTSVDVGLPGGTAWIHVLGIFFFALMGA